MDRFDIRDLELGQKLEIATESGSTYWLVAERPPEAIGGNIFRGFRITRESRRQVGVEEIDDITVTHDNEPASIQPRGSGDGEIKVGRGFGVYPGLLDEHSSNRASFDTFVTSRVVGIDLIEPIKE